jgi:hypothetical protein
MSTDPKSIKIQSSHQYFFALLGSESVKAARKMLVKLSPGHNPHEDAGESLQSGQSLGTLQKGGKVKLQNKEKSLFIEHDYYCPKF